MSLTRLPLTLLVSASLAATGLAGAGLTYLAQAYAPTDDYVVRFAGRGATGTFAGLDGSIRFAPDDLEASGFAVSVDVATIQTGNKTKDAHARGESWFDAEHYPTIDFATTGLMKGQLPQTYLAIGTLTMRGVEQELALPFTYEPSGVGGIFSATFRVDRTDFGIDGPWLAFAVDDDIVVELTIPVEPE